MSWQGMAERAAGAILRTFDETKLGDVIFYPGGNLADPHKLPWAVFDQAYQKIDPETGGIVSSTNPALGVRLVDLPKFPERKDQVNVRGLQYWVDDMQQDGIACAVLMLRRV